MAWTSQIEAWSQDPFLLMILLTASGFSYYLVLATAAYLTFFVWGRERFVPDFEPDWSEQRSAILWGFIGIFGNVIFMMPLHMLAMSGWSKIYWDVSEHGVLWVVGSTLLLLAISETAVYWTHRALHTKWLFKHIHLRHHLWRKPTPFVGVAFNPLDSFAQALPHHLCAFLFPIHGVVYIVAVSLLTMWAVAIHDRVSFVRWWWLNCCVPPLTPAA
jgi:lathosterol oxidase